MFHARRFFLLADAERKKLVRSLKHGIETSRLIITQFLVLTDGFLQITDAFLMLLNELAGITSCVINLVTALFQIFLFDQMKCEPQRSQ